MTSLTNADRNKGPLKRAVRRFPHKSQIKTRDVLMAHKDAYLREHEHLKN